MKERLLLLIMLGLFSGAALADASDANLGQFAHEQAERMTGATEVTGKDTQGQVKWAAVSIKEKQVCQHGQLNEAGRKLLQDGQHFAKTHHARLVVYTPAACANEVHQAATAAEVRQNPIADNCYMVIAK